MKDSYELLLSQFAVHILNNNLLYHTTLKRYSSLINRFFQFLEKQDILFSHAQKKDVQDYVNDMLARACSPILIAENMTALRKFFCFAQQNLGKQDITLGVELPTKPHYFIPTKKEVEKILRGAINSSSMISRDRIIIYLYYYHKMSPFSIANIMAKDVEVERAAIFDQEKKITMFLPGEWSEFLREYAASRNTQVPFFFYSESSDGATYQIAPQSISTITRVAASAFLNQQKHKPERGPIIKTNAVISSKLLALRKLYEKNHPRT